MTVSAPRACWVDGMLPGCDLDMSTSPACAPCADEVLFSWDLGGCWQSVELTEALFVDNIRCMRVRGGV